MEIAGHKLYLPANFSFLRRLPARFEIVVVGKGAEKDGLIAFELEVKGQRLVLKSGIDLKIGARYELEKINETQFKLVRMLTEADSVPQAPSSVEKAITGQSPGDVSAVFPLHTALLPHDLLAIKLLEDEGNGLLKKENKFSFDWDKRFSLSGVFVPVAGNGYSLFLAGRTADSEIVARFAEMLQDLNVVNIRNVNKNVLESIAAGAVDLRS